MPTPAAGNTSRILRSSAPVIPTMLFTKGTLVPGPALATVPIGEGTAGQSLRCNPASSHGNESERATEQQSFRSLVKTRRREVQDPDTLTVRELLGLLGKRISISTRGHFGRLKHLVLRLLSRLRNPLPSATEQILTTITASRRHAFPTNLVARSLHALPITLLRHRWRFGLAGIVVLVPASYVAYCIATIPFSGGLSIEPTPSALVVETDDGHAFATRGIFKGEKLSPDQLPAILASAVIAIEDRRFYQHGGIDFAATIRAAWHDLLGRRLEGGSTITQQLARLLYLSPERSLKRKVQEAILAIWLESHLTKQQILARYLDTAYFGAGAYGVDAAAKRYFGKSAKDVSVGEAAMLAGLIRGRNQERPPSRARRHGA
jgi:hypothetical protein